MAGEKSASVFLPDVTSQLATPKAEPDKYPYDCGQGFTHTLCSHKS
jgi:hypothetical protein